MPAQCMKHLPTNRRQVLIAAVGDGTTPYFCTSIMPTQIDELSRTLLCLSIGHAEQPRTVIVDSRILHSTLEHGVRASYNDATSARKARSCI